MNLACTSSNSPTISFFHSLLKSFNGNQNSRWALVRFRQLLQWDVNPNDLTFSLLIKACTSSLSPSASSLVNAEVEAGQIQTQLEKRGVNQFMYVNTALLDLFMKVGCIKNARKVFEGMSDRDVVSWNALICGYSRNGYYFDALGLFVKMNREGYRPRQTTIVSLAPSCAWYELILQGRSVHGLGVKAGLDCDPQVKNALTSMYAKCDDLEASELLFEEMEEKSVVSWNAMIGAYGKNGFLGKAMLLFKKMIEESCQASPVTIVSLLSANADPESIHCYAVKIGVANNASVVTSLVCVYARRGSTNMAQYLYKSLPQKNQLVSLTAIISGFSEKGDIESVVKCFVEMQQLDMRLDAVAVVSILHGITNPSHFSVGRVFHAYGLKQGLTVDHLVANGLISMYSKFDEIEAVYSLFSEMHDKQLITWNSVISGCVQAGKPRDAMGLFFQMNVCGQKPDAITIVSLLSGCCQLGYLQFGEKLHNYVLRNNVEVEDFVGTALIDMYTKCGRIEYAERVFKSIKDPCLATWNSMISGYSLYGLEHKALKCYCEMHEQGPQPDDITFLGTLAACTHGGLVHEGIKFFEIMTEEFGMVPGLQHSACMVGLFGRAGLFEEATEFIKNMELKPDSTVWGALLNACYIHQEVKLGECLAKQLLFSDYRNSGFYILMSNLYAAVGRWDDVERVRDMMRDTGGDGCSGISVIESIVKKNPIFGMIGCPHSGVGPNSRNPETSRK
ncbi:Pentatricopeptide repeat-containing protein [Quillaja saponaria]|uniref:Pentatricopeptide repeat-containing protein n=1 Tax=Quillaja saponaria TaxID=32244 RepID=A0AAD7PSJ0_QUISA|nr:Pentatricopeptide repeat-containing protein [Quillaja saponaria]